jgi:hypothetical protein
MAQAVWTLKFIRYEPEIAERLYQVFSNLLAETDIERRLDYYARAPSCYYEVTSSLHSQPHINAITRIRFPH